MINLLSPADKKDFAAGRVNALLLRYLWAVGFLFALLIVMSVLTYFALDGAKTQAEEQQKDNNATFAQYQPIQLRATEFQSNLQVAKTILEQQTNYSSVLLKIAALMPAGTTLNSISLDATTYGTPMELQIHAKTEQAAISAKSAFQNSPLFSNVQFKSITIGDTSATNAYPVTATIQVAINKEVAKQ